MTNVEEIERTRDIYDLNVIYFRKSIAILHFDVSLSLIQTFTNILTADERTMTDSSNRMYEKDDIFYQFESLTLSPACGLLPAENSMRVRVEVMKRETRVQGDSAHLLCKDQRSVLSGTYLIGNGSWKSNKGNPGGNEYLQNRIF